MPLKYKYQRDPVHQEFKITVFGNYNTITNSSDYI